MLFHFILPFISNEIARIFLLVDHLKLLNFESKYFHQNVIGIVTLFAASSSPEECHSLRSLHQCATQLQSIHKGTIQLIIIPQWPAFAPRFALTMTTDYD